MPTIIVSGVMWPTAMTAIMNMITGKLTAARTSMKQISECDKAARTLEANLIDLM